MQRGDARLPPAFSATVSHQKTTTAGLVAFLSALFSWKDLRLFRSNFLHQTDGEKEEKNNHGVYFWRKHHVSDLPRTCPRRRGTEHIFDSIYFYFYLFHRKHFALLKVIFVYFLFSFLIKKSTSFGNATLRRMDFLFFFFFLRNTCIYVVVGTKTAAFY